MHPLKKKKKYRIKKKTVVEMNSLINAYNQQPEKSKKSMRIINDIKKLNSPLKNHKTN